MNISWDIVLDNLTSVAVLLFILGFIGARFKSDLQLPQPIYQFISIYLLFGIGLKGGNALKGVSPDEFVQPLIATLLLGMAIPLFAFLILSFVKKLSEIDRGALAAHYGSTSLVTFSAALMYLENSGIAFEGFVTALLTVMEIPGIVIGVFLGARHRTVKVKWAETLQEIMVGKTVLLLVGGLLIGFITPVASYDKVAPVFVDLLGGILALFLLHLGFLAGSNWDAIKSLGKPMTVFGILFPIFSGSLGVFAGALSGLSVGGAVVLGVLCASASYIAAPAAVAIALPEANSSVALMSSIGITFPFNLVFGIPLLLELAKAVVPA